MTTSAADLQFFDLSHPWGHGVPNWPYFEDVKIERVHYHAKSRVLTQRITTVMHCTTHLDAPGHVIEGTPLVHELPLSLFFGTGVVVSIPKGKWEKVMPEDLDAARPEIRPGDIVIVNTGWHHTFGDNSTYYAYSPGFYREAGEWFVERGVKAVGTDTQALDHPLATAIAPHGPGAPNGLLPWACAEYKAETGHDVLEDFPEWEPCHRQILANGIVGFENVGGDIDEVTGKRVTIACFPWRWVGGDGCIVRMVAMLDPTGEFRIESADQRRQGPPVTVPDITNARQGFPAPSRTGGRAAAAGGGRTVSDRRAVRGRRPAVPAATPGSTGERVTRRRQTGAAGADTGGRARGRGRSGATAEAGGQGRAGGRRGTRR